MPQVAPSRRWLKAAALLEVTGVFVAGNASASLLAQWLGLASLGPVLESALQAPKPNLVPLSILLLKVLAVQYGCLLPLAFAIRWWHRRRTLAHYGLTTAGQPPLRLLALGLLAFCVVALPFKALWILQQHVPLGGGSLWWALFARNWTPSFWLFFAVGSFAVVPVVEELFYRGYCQSRLAEDFGGAGALVIVAGFFVATHGQYHQASILSISTMVCMIPIALGIGYVYLATRSLLPCIVLHAAVNFPTKGIYDILLPLVMLVALVLYQRPWTRAARDVGRRVLKLHSPAIVCAVGCAVAVAVGIQRWPDVLVPLGLTGLAMALVLEYRERRRAAVTRPDADLSTTRRFAHSAASHLAAAEPPDPASRTDRP